MSVCVLLCAGAFWGQNRISDPQELEFQVIVSHYVGPEN